MPPFSIRAFLPLAAAAFILASTDALITQVRPVYDRGAAGLVHVLERLQTTASALHTAAHPDDEDSAFIARMARGDAARVAYLSLTRGEGGQNIIGTELFEALGVIRTEELLQARRLDGGEQFFTRVIDYGFSKTLDEAKEKWNEQVVLGDVVRVIRTFRPLVIYSRFSGTPADGHGQHQMAGYITPVAFEAAADPAQFPEQIREGLRPWRAKKLYRGIGFRPDPAAPPTLELQTGIVDPVIGRSYVEIANEGRSQHKSQEMGMIETRGPQQSGLIRLDAPGVKEESVFDGIDTSVPGIASLAGLPAGSLRGELARIAAAAARALEEYEPREPGRTAPVLAEGIRATRDARAALKRLGGASNDARADADFLLAVKERDLADAIARAAQVVVDPLADGETVVPGGDLSLTVRVFAPEGTPVKIVSAAAKAPPGWAVRADSGEPSDDTDNPFARFFREAPSFAARFRVTVPSDAPVTQPYYLDEPRDGYKYTWSDDDPRGLPFAPPLLTGVVTLQVGGIDVVVTEPVQYRFADRVRGELRRNVAVVPPVTVGLDPNLLIVPTGPAPRDQRVVVRVTNHRPDRTGGALALNLPAGWTSSPADASFALAAGGETTSAPLTITAPAGRRAGRFAVTAQASSGGATFERDMQVVAYPHIQTHRLYSPAAAATPVFDLAVAPVRVGYVMGSGDRVADMLRGIGVDVTLLGDEALATGDLSRFDTIVVGIRAAESRPAFVANHNRLLQFAERGGTLVVQYQQNEYVRRGLTPYPAKMNSRVTREDAPVTILEPDHPVFTFPNRIGPADFDGWVQERNLYAFTTFDERYTPLLETADPGEPPQRGGQVHARVGKGHYIYTAYAWFRQLPAGVPGAYRQFANLISLPQAP